MNIKACTYLVTIEECKSLSKAASQLGISQPALSKFLANMESTLGHRLFIKSQKSLIPTDAGEVYLESCRNIINIKQRTYASILQLSQAPSSTITIGLTPYRGAQFFSDIYPAFSERFPIIQVKTKEGYMSELKEAAKKSEVDVVIGTVTPSDEKDFTFASVSYEQLCLAVPLSHPAASKSDDSGNYFPTIDIKEFSDAPFVMWGSSTTNAKNIEEYMARNNFTPTVVQRSNNALMMNEMLKTGVGVGFLPRSFCKAKQGRVYFSTWPPVQTFNGVFYLKEKQLSEAERYFVYLMIRNSVRSEILTGTNVYFNKTSRAIINEFGGFEM
ncbi:LysR family transcriptional regulator [Oribacterium sp. FC2011]|uniref:LysR family transcriptional regulator n=1 Tax=Oribacterium sp. FC2011 TaxID=1408311 RepID=UPI0006798A8C|nr:LysR family transcriptional regulator [Oribacterium sp. FC2011]